MNLLPLPAWPTVAPGAPTMQLASSACAVISAKRTAMDELSVVLEARGFVNKIAVTGIPVSVKAYADQIGAAIHIDHDLAPDELGCSTLIKGKYHIGVNGNDDETRRRFT